MRPLAFFSLNITGTVIRITLIFWLGDVLETPLRDIASFITRYQWYLTPITFLLVAVSLWRQGRRGRGPVETVDELQDELATRRARARGAKPPSATYHRPEHP